VPCHYTSLGKVICKALKSEVPIADVSYGRTQLSSVETKSSVVVVRTVLSRLSAFHPSRCPTTCLGSASGRLEPDELAGRHLEVVFISSATEYGA
jgi:hypothetical protein